MTKGSIYIMENPAFRDNILKISQTTYTPQKRAKQLRTTGVPAKFTVSYEEDVPDCSLAEKLIHEKLSKYRYREEREFFVMPLQEAILQVQEVTQREFYHDKKTFPLHFFKENMTMRWFCHCQDFVFIVRYENPFLSNEFQLLDCWNCEYGDQFMITNRPCDDPSELALDTAINGVLVDIIDIYPGDRIAWIGRIRNESNDNLQFSILSILDCQSYSKVARCPKKFTLFSEGGFPIPASDVFWSSKQEIPARLVVQEAISKIKKMGIPRTLGSPDINLF